MRVTVIAGQMSLLLVILVIGASISYAQSGNRDASFMPSEPEVAKTQSVAVPTGPTAVTLPSISAPALGTATATPAVPMVTAPAATDAMPPVATTLPTSVNIPVTTATGSAATVAPAAPVAAVQSIAPAPTTSPAQPAATIAVPVESSSIESVDPDSAGLLGSNSGSLGGELWKGSSYAMIERLLPELPLPTASPTLNGLARRLLLTTAKVPAGTHATSRSLTSLRIEKLIALGRIGEAWKLVQTVRPDRVDETTLRMAAEASLIGGDSKAICDQVPKLIAGHENPDWQKLLIVCQLRTGDTKAVQIGIDLLREQQVKDDTFISLINKNVLLGSKQLPRQLTPLKPLTLALLRQLDIPLPPELYARPDASLIPELLQTKASDEGAQMALAEKAAARGQISAEDIDVLYRHMTFTPEAISGAGANADTTARGHAMLYQAIAQEKDDSKRIGMAVKLMRALDTNAINGSVGLAVAELVKDIEPKSDYNQFGVAMARLFILGGHHKEAGKWLALAKDVAPRLTDAAMQMQNVWPLAALSGLVSGEEYAKEFGPWLDSVLKDADRPRLQQIGTTLLLLSAAGYSVPEDAWPRVADVAADSKRMPPSPAILIDRLRNAGSTDRKGEAVLLAVLLAGPGVGDVPLPTIVDTVRALRLAGLAPEAQALARETAAAILPAP